MRCRSVTEMSINKSSSLTQHVIVTADIGDAARAGQRVTVSSATRPAAEVCPVPDQRAAPTDPADGAETSRRTALLSAVRHQFCESHCVFF